MQGLDKKHLELFVRELNFSNFENFHRYFMVSEIFLRAFKSFEPEIFGKNGPLFS